MIMRLTRFTDYSLRVLIYLGQNNESRVTINQISEAYDISKNHLMKVVSNLTRLQFIIAQRGPGGGIKLNRLPQDITLNEVIGNTEKHLQQLQASKPSVTKSLTADTRSATTFSMPYRPTLKRWVALRWQMSWIRNRIQPGYWS